MTLLERYIFRVATIAFLAALGGLTGVIWVIQALRDLNLLTTQGQSTVIFLAVTGLVVPSLVMLIAPIALFLAVLYTLNKLNGDTELIVMSAAGSSPSLLLRPFAVLMVLVMLLDALMSMAVMPWSFRKMRDLLTQVRTDFIARVARPGDFTSLEQGFVFHYRERGPSGELLGIFMQDRRETDKIMTYLAEAGQTIKRGDQDYLVLDKGNQQRQTPDARDGSIVLFERYAIDLAQIGPAVGNVPLKPRERTTAELLWLDPSEPYVQHLEGRFRAELSDRFANPLYALVAAMIAFTALGRAKTTRQGRGTALGAAILVFTLLRVAGMGASTLVVRSPHALVLAYLIPLASVALCFMRVLGPPSISLPRLRRPQRRAPGWS